MTGARRSLSGTDKVEAPCAVSAQRRIAESALFDPSRPNIARVYDYWLGGKDNYAADRAEAEGLISVCPRLPLLARQGRLFLAKAVQWLAEQGVRQFLDLGCGLPTGQDIHHVAQAVNRDSRVVYVDADPIVLSHARALFREPGVTVMHGNLAEPGEILAELRARHSINLAEPTVVILAMVLHFFDAETARGIVTTFARTVSPGSYFVLSVGSGDEKTGDVLAREYQAGALYNHSLAQFAAFFDDLEPIPPGVTDAVAWMPGSPGQPPPAQPGGRILAGVARKPEARTRPFARV